MPRARSWTDDQLLDAIALADSWQGVCRALSLGAGGGTYAVIRRHARRLGADTAHLPGFVAGRPVTRRRFTDDELVAAVAESSTFADVMRRFGYQPSGGMHRWMKARIQGLGLDTSHFVGRGWARGKPNPRGFRARPLEELLVVGTSIGGSSLLRRLIREGLKEHRCEACQLTNWEGGPIPLELDHVNGDPADNRLENLRGLCPNCHALTPTYCGRNRGRVVELAYTSGLGPGASA